MKEIGGFEAKNKLAELLDLAEKGEEIIITRHGKQVARLGPVQKPFDREAARQAVEEITRMSKGMKLDRITIRELIDEGRRGPSLSTRPLLLAGSLRTSRHRCA